MKLSPIFVISCLLLSFVGEPCLSQTESSGWVRLLYDHKHALIMRHARAPGVGDPAGFILSDCASQRNLNDQGREQAKEIGAWLKKSGIEQASVYTSPWCRCVDTAKLLDIGKVEVAPELASTFENNLSLPNKSEDLRKFIVNYLNLSHKLPLIMVTHEVNILALLNVETSSGEMLVIELNDQGEPRLFKSLER